MFEKAGENTTGTYMSNGKDANISEPAQARYLELLPGILHYVQSVNKE